jgi:hypothetical protein
MDKPSTQAISNALTALNPGPPILAPSSPATNFIAYPLFTPPPKPSPPSWLSLPSALANGLILQDTARLNQIKTHNPLPHPVFVGAADLLIGQTQWRSVQYPTLLLPEHPRLLAVTCLEKNAPALAGVRLTQANFCPWALRSMQFRLLVRYGHVPQHVLWEQLHDYAAMYALDLRQLCAQYTKNGSTTAPIFPDRRIKRVYSARSVKTSL